MVPTSPMFHLLGSRTHIRTHTCTQLQDGRSVYEVSWLTHALPAGQWNAQTLVSLLDRSPRGAPRPTRVPPTGEQSVHMYTHTHPPGSQADALLHLQSLLLFSNMWKTHSR